jgi:hypothetical protein
MDAASQHDTAKFWLDRANEARLAAHMADRQTMLEMTALADLYEKMAENVAPAWRVHTMPDQGRSLPSYFVRRL